MNEQTIFTEAVERSEPHERAAFLDQACRGDAALRERIDRLLAQHQHAGSFLEMPAAPEVIKELAGQAYTRATEVEPVGCDGEDSSLDFLTPSQNPDSLGRLGHYDIQDVIGRGGMGIVLRAFDEQLHRVVAIKVMAAQLATNATARKRFTREAQAQAAVSHDHVVTIYAVEEDSPQPYFVMHYVAGLSSQQRLDRDGPLALPEILRIGMQTALALAAAHAQGLVHRDIKPANILLENGVERVKVTDFGLARAAAEASLTQSGVVAGTPQFMSPEQARGDRLDQRTDLFSLGSVLYAMCTGRAPFRADGSMAVLKRVCEETPTPIRDVNPEIPDWLVAIVARLHAKEPAQRFQSAAEVADVLSRHLAHVQHPSVAPLPAPILVGVAGAASARPRIVHRAGRRWTVAAAVVVLMLGGLSLTEATGVSKLRATVIRIFRPEGTLVVEVDDPGVKVTIEGDGGLIITGAGPQEVRLRPGSYKVRATKDGKAVQSELVTISRGDKQVVKVSLEAPEAAVAPADNAPADADRAAAERTLQLGGRLYLVGAESFITQRSQLPKPPFRLYSIGLASNKQVTDSGLGYLKGMSGLDTLELSRTPVSDAGLEHLKELTGLRHLYLDGTQISNAGLVHLKGLTNLLSLGLSINDGLTDAGLVHLKGLTNLSTLGFSNRDCTDAGLVHLKGLTNLSSLGLSGTATTDAGLVHLKDLTNLRDLYLASTGISDAGLEHLKGLANLRSLDLNNTRVSDAGLEHLKELKGLEELKLNQTRVSDVAVRRLQEALPNCAIISQGYPFMLLSGKGVTQRTFEALVPAVLNASDGDTIEVRGNGPFITEPINTKSALTIRAGEGFRPLIKLSARAAQKDLPLFKASGRLVLEGLDLFRPKGSKPGTLVHSQGSVAAANCRFRVEGVDHGIWTADSLTTRNCLFLGAEFFTLNGPIADGAKYDMHNCVDIRRPFNLPYHRAAAVNVTIRLTHNTIVAKGIGIQVGEMPDPLPGPKEPKRIRLDASGNIFGSELLRFQLIPAFLAKRKDFEPEKSGEALLRSLMDWNEHENLYFPDSPYLTWVMDQAAQPSKRVKTLAEWQQFWGLAGTGSLEGVAKYQGGDVLAKFATDPDRLTPEDFCLREDSPGYRAGKDGKDLGADLDLVGPGPAYERWKKTPEYQQWLKDTAHMEKAEAPKPELQAFVVLGGKGVTERKFDSLVQAVLNASDGDTIEVRGNGPFVSQPIETHGHALTIRAADGFRPVFRFAENLRTDAALVLEGLELQRVGQKVPKGSEEALVFAWGSPSLQIVNCRFREHLRLPCVRSDAPHCVLRNCEFLSPMQQAAHLDGKQCVIDNCLAAGRGLLILSFRARPDQPDISVQLTRSTLRSPQDPLLVNLVPIQPDKFAEKDAKRVWIDASGTIFDSTSVVVMNEVTPFLARLRPQPEEAKALLLRLLAWRDRGNLYAPGSSGLLWNEPPEGVAREIGPRSLADWKRLWASGDGDAVEGRVKYQGGDLLAKLRAAPEQLTPDDFRLRPDSPGYRAGKDGKDLGADVDLVGPGPTYERWKKTPEYQQWLKDTGQLRAETPKAFVVLAGNGIEVPKFDTLAEAVQGASDGDTIEIRGNGPFDCKLIASYKQPLRKALTIRAGSGFRPVLRLNKESYYQPFAQPHWLYSEAPLTLEGLEFQHVGPASTFGTVIYCSNSPFRVANCRFVLFLNCYAFRTPRSPLVEVRNCHFINAGGVLSPAGPSLLENSIRVGKNYLCLSTDEPYDDKSSFRVKNNTLLGRRGLDQKIDGPEAGSKGVGPHRWEASGNIFDLTDALHEVRFSRSIASEQAETLVHQRLDWRESCNVFGDQASFLKMTVFHHKQSIITFESVPLSRAIRSVADWEQFWGVKATSSFQGLVRYRGGDIEARLAADPASLTPEDFRLRSDSAGYRAGKDGKDLGADVDLVGPGPAYERWKKTPEYQQWLNDTKQVTNAEAPKPEPQAFVVLGGKGIEVRKYDTLAEAVQGASDGDTIEVRGNGPFVSEPITLRGLPLTIRAGDGFRPVIKLNAKGLEADERLIETDRSLVLEGLELHRVGEKRWENGRPHSVVRSVGAPLRIANCRFVIKPLQTCVGCNASPLCELRNCEFISAEAHAVHWVVPRDGRLIVDNCLQTGGSAIRVSNPHAALDKVTVQLSRNTFLGDAFLLDIDVKREVAQGEQVKPILVESSANVLDRYEWVFILVPSFAFFLEAKGPLLFPEAETLLRRQIHWRERQNLHSIRQNYLLWYTEAKDGKPQSNLNTLADWHRFWGATDADSLEARPRFQGGDLRSRSKTALDRLTPDDFRLRPDSPGYRAGKDGKDLGADVDLVGPGPAYERWKKTPEYQQWLKDSGQLKK